MTTTETAPAQVDTAATASCTCDSPSGPVPHHDYCELNHPHHPCHEECCRFASTATAPALTELIADQLCHTRVIDGQFFRFEAVDHGDGRIELDVTRVEFAAESDTTMRLLLLVSGPLTPAENVVEAEIVDEDGVEVGASA